MERVSSWLSAGARVLLMRSQAGCCWLRNPGPTELSTLLSEPVKAAISRLSSEPTAFLHESLPAGTGAKPLSRGFEPEAGALCVASRPNVEGGARARQARGGWGLEGGFGAEQAAGCFLGTRVPGLPDQRRAEIIALQAPPRTHLNHCRAPLRSGPAALGSISGQFLYPGPTAL